MLRSGSSRNKLVKQMCALSNFPFATPAFSASDGLVTAVAQDAASGRVLMVAHMNQAAWDETLASGRAVYYSRARGRLWRKGEESGNVQRVREIYVDCDADAVLLKVDQVGGAACHEGYASCFFRQVTPDGFKIIAERVFDPSEVYGKEVKQCLADWSLKRPVQREYATT
jgi:phosphoribosyl-AMP cyclohydrolase